MKYKISYKKGAKDFVAFRCPHCQDDLRCPLHEAGTIQTCPICGELFRVPGVTEWHQRQAEIEYEKQLREEQVRQLEQEAQRAQERAHRERQEQERRDEAASHH